MPANHEETNQREAIILDSVNEGVFTVGLDWRITAFNRAAERITGVSRGEAIGNPCCDVFHASVCETNCPLRRTLSDGQPVVNATAHIVNHEGARIPIRISTALLRDDTGAVAGGVETFQDLTQIEQLQKELESRYTFEDIVGHSPAMRRLFDILPQISESASTVLIEGASGTGKELFARAIHKSLAPAEETLRGRKLCGLAGHPPRKRVVRPQGRRLHRREAGQAGPLRTGQRRHNLSRRDRRHLPRHAGAAVAGLAGAPGRAARRHQDRAGGRAGGGRDQPGPDETRPLRKIPRRPLLPDPRGAPATAGAQGAPRRHPPAGQQPHRQVQPAPRQGPRRRVGRGDGPPDGARLPRQRRANSRTSSSRPSSCAAAASSNASICPRSCGRDPAWSWTTPGR